MAQRIRQSPITYSRERNYAQRILACSAVVMPTRQIDKVQIKQQRTTHFYIDAEQICMYN